MSTKFLLPFALGALFLATEAGAQTQSWTLVGADPSGAMAYSDQGDGSYVFLTRLADPTEFGDVKDVYSFLVTLKPDCAAMTEDVVSMSFYGKDKAALQSAPVAGNKAIMTDGNAGPDDIITEKCKGQALPNLDSYTGALDGAQDWLDAAIAKSAKPAS